MQETEHTI